MSQDWNQAKNCSNRRVAADLLIGKQANWHFAAAGSSSFAVVEESEPSVGQDQNQGNENRHFVQEVRSAEDRKSCHSRTRVQSLTCSSDRELNSEADQNH